MRAAPKLSVVVLTHDSFVDKSGCIRHTLAALRRQVGVAFDIIVVDNASCPSNQAFLADLLQDASLAPLTIDTIHVQLPVGEARNAGARVAKSDIIVFLDDDAILIDKHALARVQRIAEWASHGYGAQRLWTPKHPWFEQHNSTVLEALRTGRMDAMMGHLGPPPFKIASKKIFFERSYPGHFGFVRRSVFDTVGGFPADFSGYGCEDDAFGLLCYLHDPTFGWLGDLRVAHVDHPTPARYTAEYEHNLEVYGRFLAKRGLDGFQIDVLLSGNADGPDHKVLLSGS